MKLLNPLLRAKIEYFNKYWQATQKLLYKSSDTEHEKTVPLKIFQSRIDRLLVSSLSKSACINIDTGSVNEIDCYTVRNERLLRSASTKKLQSLYCPISFLRSRKVCCASVLILVESVWN